MAPPALTAPLFAILSALIEERLGLSYSPQDQDLLASKLLSRANEIGFDSLLDYYYFLRYDADNEREFQALTNVLVVNETFFFREFLPLKVVVSDVIAPLIAAGHTPRIWCAACSTGEEPLSLAMLLDQQQLLARVELLATDVSTQALARAQSGRHVKRSLRHIPAPELAEKWLSQSEDDVWVKPELLQAVRWQQLNLMDRTAISELGSFDLILCRNVLIYFRDAVVSRVVGDLGAQLNPNGVLLVGIAESLMRFSSALECEERANVFFYRKPAL